MKSYTTTNKIRARSLRKSTTDAEAHLWHQLRNRNLRQFKFRRQHPIGPYIVDFVCLEHKLVIELDGSQHLDQVDYDYKRTVYLEQAGFRIIRFWDNDVLAQTGGVMQALYAALGHPSP